jgi:hypothetical protein
MSIREFGRILERRRGNIAGKWKKMAKLQNDFYLH